MFKPLPNNDRGCGWLHGLPTRQPRPSLQGEHRADLVIIGAGYTGLSAARQFGLMHPNKKVIVLDAQQAAEGASARNSGYLVDSTLNDGHMSDTGLQQYQAKYALNKAGLDTVANLVKRHRIDCDWDECGKYHATHSQKNETKLQHFSDTLKALHLPHQVLSGQALQARLGTAYYCHGIWTQGSVMLQPAKLGRAYINLLPDNVSLYEHSPALHWQSDGTITGKTHLHIATPLGAIKAPQLLLAVNGFMAPSGIQTKQVLPLTLTASMTRPLTDSEYASLGKPKAWGLLSAQAMGATVRFTQDKRIIIRNTAEVWPRLNMAKSLLAKRQALHILALQRRFPQLPTNTFNALWSGVTCISGNNAQVFTRLQDNVFVAGCYNGGGIGLSTLFGEQMAYYMSGEMTDTIAMIEARPPPMRLPPQPLLNWGVRLHLMRDRWMAVGES